MASKRNLRRRSCQGKIRFPTEEAALGGIRGHFIHHSEELQSYHCNECGGYHNGHRPLKLTTGKEREYLNTLHKYSNRG